MPLLNLIGRLLPDCILDWFFLHTPWAFAPVWISVEQRFEMRWVRFEEYFLGGGYYI